MPRRPSSAPCLAKARQTVDWARQPSHHQILHTARRQKPLLRNLTRCPCAVRQHLCSPHQLRCHQVRQLQRRRPSLPLRSAAARCAGRRCAAAWPLLPLPAVAHAARLQLLLQPALLRRLRQRAARAAHLPMLRAGTQRPQCLRHSAPAARLLRPCAAAAPLQSDEACGIQLMWLAGLHEHIHVKNGHMRKINVEHEHLCSTSRHDRQQHSQRPAARQ